MRLLLVLAGFVALAACNDRKCPEAPAPASSPSTAAPSVTGAVPLKVAARCLLTDEYLTVYVPIVATYTGERAVELNLRPSRTLWSFTCDRRKRECNGAHLVLDSIDRGEGLKVDKLNSTAGATLVTSQGAIHVLRWGSSRTFTVDTATHKVTYAESADRLEGRGVADCSDAPRGE